MSGETTVEKWLCSCGKLLGYVEDKRILRIKRKDLFIEFKMKDETPNVTVNCCGCGKRNELNDTTG